MTEAMLQSIICSYFNDNYPNLLMWSSLNGVNLSGAKNKYQTIVELKKQCMIKGVSDLYVALPEGKGLHIELKVGNNKQSDDQVQIEQTLNNLGHKYYVVKSLAEFKEVMKENLYGGTTLSD